MISPNNKFSDPRHELWTLLESLCEDRLTEEQTGRLEEWVLTDASARRIYRDYIELHGSLYWDTALAGETTPIPPASPAERNGKPPRLHLPNRPHAGVSFRRNRVCLALAVLFIAGLAFWRSGGFRNETIG